MTTDLLDPDTAPAGAAPAGGGAVDPMVVLRAARDEQRAVDAGQVRVLEHVLAWALANPETDVEQAEAFPMPGPDPDPERAGRLGGQGCPGVAPSAVAEIALALGMTTDTGRNLVSDTLALAFRLPATWVRVLAGQVPVWRARSLAQATHALSWVAARWVDAQAAPFAHRLSGAQTDRLVQAALAEHMPALAEQHRQAAADGRYVAIDLDQADLTGTVPVHATVDLADALDLDNALRAGATHLRDLGCEQSLDVRRSLALGDLARHQPPLPLDASGQADWAVAAGSAADGGGSGDGADLGDLVDRGGGLRGTDGPSGGVGGSVGSAASVAGANRRFGPHGPVDGSTDQTSSTAPNSPTGPPPRRPVMLYLHLTDQHLTTEGSTAVGWCDNTRTAVTPGQIRTWLGAPNTTITVRPVIDTRQLLTSGGYVPAPVLDEQIRLRDRVCGFPGCTRPARTADLDHTIPYASGGPTSSENLAALCRGHHNLKTHHRWRYVRDPDGSTTWTTPAGHTYRSHPHGGWHPITLTGEPPGRDDGGGDDGGGATGSGSDGPDPP